MIEICQNTKKQTEEDRRKTEEDRRRQKKTEKDRRKTEKDRTFHSILFGYYIQYLDIIFNLYIVFIMKTEEDSRKT